MRDCFQLLDDDPASRIIASVPRMVGMTFLLKCMIQRARGNRDDQMPAMEVLRSAFLNDTSRLEPLWNGGHVGFSHLRLEHHLKQEFRLLSRVGTLTSVFYEIGRR